MKYVFLLAAVVISSSIVNAAGTFYDFDAELKSAKTLIYKENYAQAIEKLKAAVASEPDNADAWNLLGYAERKSGQLNQSAQAYKKALGINPDHKDALEYQGELFLLLGNNAAAEKNLAKLKSLCPTGCEQIEMLMRAIAAQ